MKFFAVIWIAILANSVAFEKPEGLATSSSAELSDRELQSLFVFNEEACLRELDKCNAKQAAGYTLERWGTMLEYLAGEEIFNSIGELVDLAAQVDFSTAYDDLRKRINFNQLGVVYDVAQEVSTSAALLAATSTQAQLFEPLYLLSLIPGKILAVSGTVLDITAEFISLFKDIVYKILTTMADKINEFIFAPIIAAIHGIFDFIFGLVGRVGSDSVSVGLVSAALLGIESECQVDLPVCQFGQLATTVIPNLIEAAFLTA